ncbi:inner centromere protein isoform X2 [Genypterus blacodes]|uniref:inner centromere protein isoform X2 n=1 Tax=Genypterus blacodes TaxID=154954 RepID=UPI003F76F3C8
MNSVLASVRTLMQMFDEKTNDFISDIDNVHMVWLEEIQQEANRMFSRDFSAEPELMPKTPSQKKNSRRKRVSLGRQEENPTKRRFSKGRRSNLRRSSVKSLNHIAEEEAVPEASTSEDIQQPKRSARNNRKAKPEEAADESQLPHGSCTPEQRVVQNKKPVMTEEEEEEADKHQTAPSTEVKEEPVEAPSKPPSPPKLVLPEIAVSISSLDRLSAEQAQYPEASPGRTAAKIEIAGAARSSRRSSVRCSLKLRHSLAGLRHSMTQESVRRASRRSMLKNKATRLGNSTCSSNVSDACMDSVEEDDGEPMQAAEPDINAEFEELEDSPEVVSTHRSIGRVTRSVAANSPTLAPPALFSSNNKGSASSNRSVAAVKKQPSQSRSRQSTKRKAPDTVEESPTKRVSPPKKSQSAIRPHMKSFLHTVQKNQMLMMTPCSLGRTAVVKSFIKYATPVKVNTKPSSGVVQKELLKLEALKKKQEQEEERMKKMEEDKKKKQDELRRKRDERMRRVNEAKVKEEQREEEKKKKIEQKMAHLDEKNDKLRLAEEKAKKKVVMKRQEEVEQRRKLEEEIKKKKLQQAEEEKRQQELLAKRKMEEEERARKLAEARRALELKREQEREREKELERERMAAAERERVERLKAITLQRELERAAREKQQRELDEKRKELEERRRQEEVLLQRMAAEEKAAQDREAAAKRAAEASASKAAALNVTVDIERSVMHTPVGKGGGLNVTVDMERPSPQSYSITPKGGNKPVSKNPEDYGMDQNSDDSTDDESAPRKPIPSWAEGHNLQQIIMKQYFNPPDLDSFFGDIEPPKLENIFYKTKPRYFKRTSSAVWNSPPRKGNHY